MADHASDFDAAAQALPPIQFASLQDYAAQFTRAEFWEPYVRAICARHNLHGNIVAADLAGTNPVFIIEPSLADLMPTHCVVKIYETRLFDGLRSCRMERAVYGLMARHLYLPAPKLIAQGDLFGDGAWPYNVMSIIPGRSLSHIIDQLTPTDRLNIATFLGRHLRELHHLPVTPALLQAREPFRTFLREQYAACAQRHREWNSASAHLLDTLQTYLIDEAEWDTALLEPSPHLIHADLNADHVLVQSTQITQIGPTSDVIHQPSGIIDFGDARIGDRLYELVPLHLGLFGGDTTLLRAFMAAYGPDADLQRDFVRRAMNFTVLFQFNALSWVAEAKSAASWEALADCLWNYER